MLMQLGDYGVFRRGSLLTPAVAVALEGMGYGTIWVGGSPPGDLHSVEALLDATSTVTVATGIVNIWSDDAATIASSYHRIEGNHPGRFLLGVGVGHPEAVTQYVRPYAALVAYLDELDAGGVPPERRVLAALGPKVLALSAHRSLGAHPYLVPAEHSRRAREILGAGPLLAPEHKAVLDPDPIRARAIARPAVQKPYLGLVNYTNNLRSLGFGDDDLSGSGSDRLIDAVVAHGDAAAVTAGLRAHLDAGADHVAVNLLTESGADPLPGLSQLAEALFESPPRRST
jgi:probable F420-dependent oxidoreductase